MVHERIGYAKVAFGIFKINGRSLRGMVDEPISPATVFCLKRPRAI